MDELRSLARTRGQTVSAIVNSWIEQGLVDAGFPHFRGRSGMPRVEALLRELVHRQPPVVGGGHAALLQILNRGYSSPQRARVRARLAWCIAHRFVLEAGTDRYRLNPGEIHRRLCDPLLCSWILEAPPARSSQSTLVDLPTEAAPGD